MMNTKHDKQALAFLPAALEVRDTPPSAAGRAILWTIMIFFIAAVIWAGTGHVDIVATAEGKIIPSGRVKVIQPLEAGVVKHILVKEGQLVNEGEALLELDATVSGADLQRLNTDRMATLLDKARLEALISAIRQEAAQPINAPADAKPLQTELQAARLEMQFGEYRARLSSLTEEIRQRQAERAAIAARAAQLKATIPLISERVRALKKMADKRLGPRERWLELEQERIEQVKEREIQHHKKKVVEAAVAGLQQQQNLLRVQIGAQYLAEFVEARRKLAGLEQEIVKVEQRLALQLLKAPATGRIQQMAVHTVGGVVTPAQQLMVIVPESDRLEVEAWVYNKDIGFIEEGQIAEVKVNTFPFTKYGTIDAEVLTLSQDAVAKENIGLVYAARVSLKQKHIKVNKRQVSLTPGMAVTVEIKTGKRRLIEFFLSPLLRYKQESVRER
ncbi:MAG: HlyD family type I secretion periplasmic adaptor subunit [Gammaproteobacteria bacterium]|nr:HlyD family type I secretion periplasmic adaptor subunit [Gammaproteobacteria bacterium]